MEGSSSVCKRYIKTNYRFSNISLKLLLYNDVDNLIRSFNSNILKMSFRGNDDEVDTKELMQIFSKVVCTKKVIFCVLYSKKTKGIIGVYYEQLCMYVVSLYMYV